MKKYKAIVRDKQTGERVIICSKSKSKQEFITDLRGNGYSVSYYKVKREEVFRFIMESTNARPRDWKDINFKTLQKEGVY